MHRHSSSFTFILLTKLELGPLNLGTKHVIRTAVGIVLMQLLSERVFFLFPEYCGRTWRCLDTP